MDGLETQTNYSAAVDMWLDCYSRGKVRLAHVASSFVIADAGAEVPAGPANIILTVDGRKYERRVRLLDNLSPTNLHSLVEPYDEIPI
jgi:hypothetical protein